MINFAKEIKAIRKALEMSQAEFAEAASVSQGSVSKWERGLEEPKTAAWLRIKSLYETHEGHRVSGPFDIFMGGGQNVTLVPVQLIGALERPLKADVFADSYPTLLMLSIPYVEGISDNVLAWVVPQVLADGSVDLPAGTIIFVDAGDKSYEPEQGDRVVVQWRTLDEDFSYSLAYYGRSEKGMEWFTGTPVPENKVRLSATNQIGKRKDAGLRVVGRLSATLRWESPTLNFLEEITKSHDPFEL